jgi:hypothetical protein
MSAQNKIQSQSLEQTRKIASADLVLRLRKRLDGTNFDKLAKEIQAHDQTYALRAKLNGGKGIRKFGDADIEDYINNFEDIGYLIEDGVIDTKMAYDDFSYDVEKAWCNLDVRRLTTKDRQTDKSTFATSDPIYGHFENLAKSYLDKEKQTCDDLDKQ